MTAGEGISKVDLWILDRVFQPLADRLPERLPAFELGMSLLFGSLMLSAAATVAMVVFFHMGMMDVLFDGLIWFMWVSFYIGVNRLRALIRPGFVNPLRTMFLGLRPISLVFLAYVAWQGTGVPGLYALAPWFNTLANFTFVLGVYLVSCNTNPPERKATVWQKDFAGAPD
ncbi:hypothetical protein [Acetobacter estunensis]|uniref:hypothetical protein n=1 Tax=Acetobacter estunensis TaxID=104097 RepID=UPI001C2DDE18|nr:hypothetical protein [Acetobacter estunensis]MBV1836940.1 hypothetical protein [Acetobacter estunensis]